MTWTPAPSCAAGRKDNAEMEVVWRGIAHAVTDFFYANEDDLLLEVHYGSTGLAVMQKLAPMTRPAQPATRVRRRRVTLRSLARRLLRRD